MPLSPSRRSYECLEEKGFFYAIRLPANEVLQAKIETLLTRPVGCPPRKPIVWFADFSYPAASWDRPRRVIAKVEWHRGELFPRVGFIVNPSERTSLRIGSLLQWTWHGRAVDQERHLQPTQEVLQTLAPWS